MIIMAKKKKEKTKKLQEKQVYPVYVSDLSKTLEERVTEFYTRIYLMYCQNRDNTDSQLKKFCLGLDFFHECVKNLDSVLLGETPFSCRKINKDAFLKNFSRKERPIVNKAIDLFENAEIENNSEKEKLQQSQTILSRLLSSLWQTFKDCSAIVSFALATNGLGMLFEALKICRKINYNMAKNK